MPGRGSAYLDGPASVPAIADIKESVKRTTKAQTTVYQSKRKQTPKMLNAHFKSSGFSKNQRDLRVQIEQPLFPPPEVRDMKPGGGWFPWLRLSP